MRHDPRSVRPQPHRAVDPTASTKARGDAATARTTATAIGAGDAMSELALTVEAHRRADVIRAGIVRKYGIAQWTWEQLALMRSDAVIIRRTYSEKIAHYDRLLALHDMCPESETPAEAARLLGINIDEFLGLEAV